MRSGRREYWDVVADEWVTAPQHQLWRRHSDVVNSDLMNSWLSGQRRERLLKTDLFDEVVSEGLYPVLSRHVDRVFGIDISDGIVDAAMRRYPELDARTADVRELPYEDAFFDEIVSLSTLDHFDKLQHVDTSLAEFHRVLKPGGQLILTLDNLWNPVIWLRSVLPMKLLLGLGLVPYRVGKTCGPRRLQALCANAGFVVEETTAIMHCPRVLAVAVARLVGRRSSSRAHDRYLGFLQGFERLEKWPTRSITGHFTAIRAIKPEGKDDFA